LFITQTILIFVKMNINIPYIKLLSDNGYYVIFTKDKMSINGNNIIKSDVNKDFNLILDADGENILEEVNSSLELKKKYSTSNLINFSVIIVY